METLAFYSYKGGVGRSLLLANAARYIASLGKGVVVLDLDLEAPGLHYKLGRTASRDGGPAFHGGAVPYLVATAQEAISPPSLEEHMIEVPVPPDPRGWLRLMPAGPAPDKAYWTALKQLGDQVRLDDPSGQGLMALLDLHARIEEELKPDYLLIDARTGVTELGGLATTLLADTVVCMFVANQESLDGTLTVAEAVRAAPRFKGRRPVRIVPVLTRTTSAPPVEGPFAEAVKRLLHLREGRESSRRKMPSKLYVLPHDEAHGAADRVIGGEKTASAFSPLYKAYLELFQHIFPSSARRAQEALVRLEAIASLKEELMSSRERLLPWQETAIDEGVLYQSETYRPADSRYADLLCHSSGGRPLMVAEYVSEDAADAAKIFWERNTSIRCLVLLRRTNTSKAERIIFARGPDEIDLRHTNRWDLPMPEEFELFPDVGDRSIEAMLSALRYGRVEATTWLIDEWQECMAAVAAHTIVPPLRPIRARRILDGLASTEDPDLAELILHRVSPAVWNNLGKRWGDDFESSWAELSRWTAKYLFAPLFWRLPVEAVSRYAEPSNPEGTFNLAGYRLLAHDLMGLRYDPGRRALVETQALGRWTGYESADDSEDLDPAGWLQRSRRAQLQHIHLSDAPPPLLLWEEVLRADRYWYGTFEEARVALDSGAIKKLISTPVLRSRLREMRDRRELAIDGLLGEYVTGTLVVYPKVIAVVADLLSISARYLKSVVFIHLAVRALAHQSHDLDEQPGYGFAPATSTSPLHRESPVHVTIVQCFTRLLIDHLEDSNLMAAFEKLSQHQPEPYRQWITFRDVPLEQLRIFLLRARASAAALGMSGTRESG